MRDTESVFVCEKVREKDTEEVRLRENESTREREHERVSVCGYVWFSTARDLEEMNHS